MESNRLYRSNLILSLMNFAIYISLFSAIFTVSIGIYVFLLNPKKITNRVFTVFVLFVAIFSISEYMTRVSATKELALLFGRICYSIFPLISCLAVHFSLVFPRKYPNDNNIFSRYKSLLPSLYVVGIITTIIFNLLVSIQDVKMSEWGYRVILTPSTEFIIYWLLVCSCIATFSLAHTYFKKRITTNEKRQIQFVTIGLLLVVALSLGTNLIPPLFGMSVFPMTTVSLMLFSFIVAYSMIRYRLMKLTTAETADVVIDTMADSLFVIDGNKTIVNVNKSALDLLGYTRKELMNVSLENIVNLPHFESNIFSKASADGRIEDVETEFFTKERKSIPMNISASSIYNDGGEPEGTVIVARDLTETKNFIKKLEEAKNNLEKRVKGRTAELEKSKRKVELQNIQLKKLDQLKTDFLNTTSHELRTPVASIKGYIQMLLKRALGEITEEQKKALEVLLRNTNRLDHLIQDILDISNLESGTMKFIPEKTDVTKMVKEVAETMQASADSKRIKINIDIQKEIPDLMIDSERIKQVLVNLVDNAIKFSPEGLRIQIKTRKKKEDVLFEVQDFGRGIPKNKQKKIFERFYQVDSGIDRKFGGVGLGLTISKKIIDTYGGKIWVDSTVGKGSSFKFSLPLQSAKNIEGDIKEIYL
jgi:PAS domain S-box-containing protein